MPLEYVALRTPYPSYHVLLKIAVPRTLFRALGVRCPSCSVPVVPGTKGTGVRFWNGRSRMSIPGWFYQIGLKNLVIIGVPFSVYNQMNIFLPSLKYEHNEYHHFLEVFDDSEITGQEIIFC